MNHKSLPVESVLTGNALRDKGTPCDIQYTLECFICVWQKQQANEANDGWKVRIHVLLLPHAYRRVACCSGTRTDSYADFCSLNTNSFFSHVSVTAFRCRTLSYTPTSSDTHYDLCCTKVLLISAHNGWEKYLKWVRLLNDADNYYFIAVQLNELMILECWWKDIERGKLKYSGKQPLSKQLQPPQILHGMSVIEARPLRRKRGEWPPESRQGQQVRQPIKISNIITDIRPSFEVYTNPLNLVLEPYRCVCCFLTVYFDLDYCENAAANIIWDYSANMMQTLG
jgi:hypothetical protein